MQFLCWFDTWLIKLLDGIIFGVLMASHLIALDKCKILPRKLFVKVKYKKDMFSWSSNVDQFITDVNTMYACMLIVKH